MEIASPSILVPPNSDLFDLSAALGAEPISPAAMTGRLGGGGGLNVTLGGGMMTTPSNFARSSVSRSTPGGGGATGSGNSRAAHGPAFAGREPLSAIYPPSTLLVTTAAAARKAAAATATAEAERQTVGAPPEWIPRLPARTYTVIVEEPCSHNAAAPAGGSAPPAIAALGRVIRLT